MSQTIAQSVAKNTTVMMSSQLVTWLSSFILMLVLPRMLGSEEYGRLYLAISFTMIFQIFIDFGGPYFITKEVSRHRERAANLVAHSILLRAVLWFASMVVMAVFCLGVAYSEKVTALILILGVAKLWEGVYRVLGSTFQGLEMMEYTALGVITERVFVTLAGVSVLVLGADTVIIALVMVLGVFLNAAVVYRHARRHFFQNILPVRWDFVWDLVKKGFPYFLYTMCAIIYYRVDVVMLSLMTNEAVVGWYGVSYRLFDVLMFLPSILSLAVFPVLSRLNEVNRETLTRVTQKSLDLIILAGIPISIVSYFFSEQIISLFFGMDEFAPSVLLLRMFSAGLLLVYIDFVLGTALFATDKQRRWTLVAFGALVLNLVLNAVLIPYTQLYGNNGGIGAAVATIVTELFVMLMAIAILPKSILARTSISIQVKGLSAGVLTIGTAWVLSFTGLFWILQALFSAIAYIVSLLLFKAIHPEDTEFLQRFLTIRNIKSIFAFQKQGSV